MQDERRYRNIKRAQAQRQLRNNVTDKAARERGAAKRHREGDVVGALHETCGKGADAEKGGLAKRYESRIAGEEIERDSADDRNQTAVYKMNPERRENNGQRQQCKDAYEYG